MDAPVGSNPEIQLRLRVAPALQERQRDPQEAHRFGRGMLSFSRLVASSARSLRFDRRRDGPAARDDPEVGELHFERHRPPPGARRLAVQPDLVDQRFELCFHGSNSVRSVANVFSAPIDFRIRLGSNGPFVDAARDPVVVGARLAEVSVHKLQRLVAHVETREDAKTMMRTDEIDGNQRYSWTKNQRSWFVSGTRPCSLRRKTIK